MQCFVKRRKTACLLNVENAETTGERGCHLSRRTPLNSSVCTFIGLMHVSPTLMCIIPMNLRLTTFTKTVPQMQFHIYVLLFYFALGLHAPMTLLTDGALIYPQLPATGSNVFTTDARLGSHSPMGSTLYARGTYGVDVYA